MACGLGFERVQSNGAFLTPPSSSSHSEGRSLLAIYANRPPCRSWWPVFVLNGVMLFSIPSQGGHGLVDVLAGAALAGIAIWAARGWRRWAATIPLFQRQRDPVTQASAPHAME